LGFCGYPWIPDPWVGSKVRPVGTQFKVGLIICNRRMQRSGVIGSQRVEAQKLLKEPKEAESKQTRFT